VGAHEFYGKVKMEGLVGNMKKIMALVVLLSCVAIYSGVGQSTENGRLADRWNQMEAARKAKGLCNNVTEIVDQVTKCERLTAHGHRELTRVLRECEQSQLLYSERARSDKGYEIGIRDVKVLHALKPFITDGGSPFLEHCLFEAIVEGDLEKVTYLVDELLVSVDAVDTRSSTVGNGGIPALHVATMASGEECVDVLDFLLQRGANTEVIYKKSNVTPLGYLLKCALYPMHACDNAKVWCDGRLRMLMCHATGCDNIVKDSHCKEKITTLLRHGANFDTVAQAGHGFTEQLEQEYEDLRTGCRLSAKQLEAVRARIDDIGELPAVVAEIRKRQKPELVEWLPGPLADIALDYLHIPKQKLQQNEEPIWI
jgi:hypothetical protein